MNTRLGYTEQNEQSLNRFNALQLLLPLAIWNIENQALAAGAQPDFHPLLEAFNCQNDSPSACYNVPFDLLAKALHQRAQPVTKRRFAKMIGGEEKFWASGFLTALQRKVTLYLSHGV